MLCQIKTIYFKCLRLLKATTVKQDTKVWSLIEHRSVLAYSWPLSPLMHLNFNLPTRDVFIFTFRETTFGNSHFLQHSSRICQPLYFESVSRKVGEKKYWDCP